MPSPEEVEDAIARLEPLVVVQGERDPETWDEFVKRQLDEEEPRAQALRTLISAARSAQGTARVAGSALCQIEDEQGRADRAEAALREIAGRNCEEDDTLEGPTCFEIAADPGSGTDRLCASCLARAALTNSESPEEEA